MPCRPWRLGSKRSATDRRAHQVALQRRSLPPSGQPRRVNSTTAPTVTRYVTHVTLYRVSLFQTETGCPVSPEQRVVPLRTNSPYQAKGTRRAIVLDSWPAQCRHATGAPFWTKHDVDVRCTWRRAFMQTVDRMARPLWEHIVNKSVSLHVHISCPNSPREPTPRRIIPRSASYPSVSKKPSNSLRMT